MQASVLGLRALVPVAKILVLAVWILKASLFESRASKPVVKVLVLAVWAL